ELQRERRAGFVALLARVGGVAADVGEQERPHGLRGRPCGLRRGGRVAAKRVRRRLDELAAGRIPQVSILGKRRFDDEVERGRQVRAALGDGRDWVVHVRQQRRELVATLEGRAARQAFVEDTSEGVDVHASVHWTALDLF